MKHYFVGTVTPCDLNDCEEGGHIKNRPLVTLLPVFSSVTDSQTGRRRKTGSNKAPSMSGAVTLSLLLKLWVFALWIDIAIGLCLLREEVWE